MPYFSVIIPVYNRPDEVRELLESLSKQTLKDFEVLLIEDGSVNRCDTVPSVISRLSKLAWRKIMSIVSAGLMRHILLLVICKRRSAIL